MRLIAIGGDERMNGLLRAARRGGYDCTHIRTSDELSSVREEVSAIALPWPRSFVSGMAAYTQMPEAEVLANLPPCSVLMGGGIDPSKVPQAEWVIDPGKDEAFLVDNAKLTAEGACAALLNGAGAMMGKTCLVTGFGRIAKALVRRLTALEMFVIVCARNAQQMQTAHHMGAHPVPLAQIALAGMQADVVINTVPARIFTGEALAQMKPGVRFIELAGIPYGADPEQAADFGVSMEIMGGLPGKYAPQEAGEALFGVLERAIGRQKGEDA